MDHCSPCFTIDINLCFCHYDFLNTFLAPCWFSSSVWPLLFWSIWWHTGLLSQPPGSTFFTFISQSTRNFYIAICIFSDFDGLFCPHTISRLLLFCLSWEWDPTSFFFLIEEIVLVVLLHSNQVSKERGCHTLYRLQSRLRHCDLTDNIKGLVWHSGK